MSTNTSREIQLVSHPKGMPTAENFRLVQCDVKAPEDGEVLVRNRFISVDPYMRGRMNEGKSYIPSFELQTALEGAAVGEVVESRADGFKLGDAVISNCGWRERFISKSDDLRRVSRDHEPLSIHLGALGVTGMTAWVGLKVAQLEAGDVVYVSGAAGAVGTVAGQLAKLRGCRVIGSAGSAEKVAFLLKECGFDAAFNYKDGSVRRQLEVAAPDGVDIFFDNVGGEALQAALSCMRPHGWIIACGGISGYNATKAPPGPTNLFNMITKRLTMKGIMVRDWAAQRHEFEKEVGDCVREGTLKHHETVVDGLERAVDAFLGLFHGQNTGKMIVRLPW